MSKSCSNCGGTPQIFDRVPMQLIFAGIVQKLAPTAKYNRKLSSGEVSPVFTSRPLSMLLFCLLQN
jgi:hypothetical protein